MIISDRVFDEVESTIKTTLGLDVDSVITKAPKFQRFDWRELIHYFETSQPGLEPPYVVIRPLPEIEAHFGMSNMCYWLELDIYFIQSERNYVATTVTEDYVANGIIKVTSTTGMFVGQKLFVSNANLAVRILTVDSATQITVETGSLAIDNGDDIYSDIMSDVTVLMEKLRQAFAPGTSFTNFQLMEDPLIDVTDLNAVNEQMGGNGYPLFAGSCSVKLLVGETL